MAPDNALKEETQLTLFQTEAWHSAWMEAWGQLIESERFSQILPAQGAYVTRQRIKNFMQVNTSFPLGSPSKKHPSIRREFCRYDRQTIRDFLNINTSQFVFSDIVVKSPTYYQILEQAREFGYLVVEQDDCNSFSVNTSTGTFETYISSLSSSTKDRLYKGRQKLENKGVLILENLWPDIDLFVSILNGFHTERWRKPCYTRNNLVMIRKLLNFLEREGHAIDLSALKFDGKIVSLTLDVLIKGRKYNLQSGFDGNLGMGVSPGMIHFGLNIEEGFKEKSIKAYDFMAGTGKHTDYKKKIANQSCKLTTFVVVKKRWLAGFYRAALFLRGITKTEGSTVNVRDHRDMDR